MDQATRLADRDLVTGPSPEAAAAHLAARLRRGDLDETQVRVLAKLGHAGAVLLTGERPLPVLEDVPAAHFTWSLAAYRRRKGQELFTEWFQALLPAERTQVADECWARACHAVTLLLLPIWVATYGEDEALEVERLIAAHAAGEPACDEQLVGLADHMLTTLDVVTAGGFGPAYRACMGIACALLATVEDECKLEESEYPRTRRRAAALLLEEAPDHLELGQLDRAVREALSSWLVGGSFERWESGPEGEPVEETRVPHGADQACWGWCCDRAQEAARRR